MIDYDRYLAIPDLYARAVAFATDVHGAINHRRKYSGEPYVTHPLAVADIVRRRPHTVVMLVAAVLHDTVEDTFATLYDIAYLFGFEVARMVADLTDVGFPSLGNRTTRKALDRAHTAAAQPGSKTVKCADCLHNGEDILANDPHFAVWYLREMKLLCDEPLEGADPILLAEVRAMVATHLGRIEAEARARRAERQAAHAAREAEDRARKRGLKGLAPVPGS
jgi:hypothetical protein